MIPLSTSCKRCKRFGFTLIEMMIVILIISVLLGIALPAYFNVRENSRAKVCRSHLRHLQDAKERWALENHYDNSATATMDDLMPTYLKTEPICPSSGTYQLGSVGDNPVCSEAGHTIY